ncbi:MAG: BON domain-containing protein [Acidimicrobiales bacterium]
MWGRLWIPVLALGLGLSAQTAPAAPLPIVPAQGNSTLTGRIMQRLTEDPVLRLITITASVGENGAVSLNGVVPTQALNDRAVDVVKSVAGVQSVNSRILVNQDPFAPRSQSSASATALPPITAAPPPPPAARDPQALLADALARDPALARVSSRVYDGKVMLIGTVTQSQARDRAERVAKQAVPKLPVTNIIWVDPHPLAPPPLLPASLYGTAGHR